MDNKLMTAMQQDMKISRYKGEPQEYYVGRLVYSAISHWIRYIILDELTQNQSCKSKSYVLKRGQVVLDNLVESAPMCREWIFGYEKYIDKDQDEPVRNVREKMILAGELMEIDENGNLGLPKYHKEGYTTGYARIKGLKEPEEASEFVGITRIQNTNVIGTKDLLINRVEPEQYVDWLFKNASWSECANIENYEVFNPYSKKPPYQAWSYGTVKSEGHYLGRLSLYNGMHEYYLVKNKIGTWYNSKLSTVLTEYKEERRIILGLRKKYGNKMTGIYSMMESVVILNLFCRLPLKEQVIIETFCWPLEGLNDRLNYVVPIKLWSEIKDLIANDLGIELKEKI